VADPVRNLIKRTLLRPLLYQAGSPATGAVALTFDDGPNPRFTAAVLDALQRHAARATFFLVGERVAQCPAEIARMLSDGHEIGNHSLTHADFSALSLRGIEREVRATDRVLRDAGLRQERIRWRPPKGALNVRTLCFAIKHRRRVAMWSNDPKDFSARSVDELRRHFDAQPVRAGDIVLLHDSNPVTVAWLDVLLPQLQAAGLRPVTLSSLLGGPRR
jgi:peptidoglycan/xylan/chitin deacetylase (PgdA/CDA1 family)